MPNALATLALLGWPLVAVWLFRRLDPGRALIVVILAGYLLLPPPPAGFDLPLLPAITKDNLPGVVALLCLVLMHRPGRGLIPESAVMRGLVLLFVLSPLATVLGNGDPVRFGAQELPGLRLTEAISTMIQQALLVAPLLMARHLLGTAQGQRDLLAAFAVGGLAYSLPMLLEVRLSPQLNVWIYGYFQHDFGQMMRQGGFRPIVFLYHGLWVAFFAMTALLAAAALARAGGMRARGVLVTLWLLGVLVLCKSMASLFYALAALPLVLAVPPRRQIRVALVLGVLACAWPLMRDSQMFPRDTLLSQVGAISTERAASLQFRLDNEDLLMARAAERPVFGWGLWGRNHILDPGDGKILTVTDGRWVILIGVWGWAGFVAEFGLLLWPLVLAARAGQVTPWIGALSLILALNMVDMIPNATLTPLTWLVAGAILGHAEVRDRRRQPGSDTLPTPLVPGPPSIRTVL